jgi:hypothetical protein
MLLGSERAKQVIRLATKSTERLRILLAGESTTGKTTSLMTLPDALRAVGVEKPRIVVADFDQGGDELLDHPEFEVYRFGGIPGSDPESFPAADHWLSKEVTELGEINVFITDSVTSLSMCMLTTVAKDNGRLGKMPQLQDWNHEMHATQKWILDIQNLPVTHAVITIAHTYMEKDDLSGRAYNKLVLTGKLPAKIVRLFPEIYFASKGTGKTPKFTWQTVPDVQTAARTMIKDFRIQAGIEQDFAPVFKKWFKAV